MTNHRAVSASLVLLTLSAFVLIPTRTSPVATARQQPPAQNTNRVERPIKSPCPYSVNISGPTSVAEGDVITFSADVDYSGQSALTYIWTVSPPAARIVSGAGTPTISVDTTGVRHEGVTADLVVDDGSGNVACRQRAAFTVGVARVAMTTNAPLSVGTPAATPALPRPTPFSGVVSNSNTSAPVTGSPAQPPSPVGGAGRRRPLPEPMMGNAPPPTGPPLTSSAPPATPSPKLDEDADYTLVRVFYGTDRRRTGARAASKFYGAGHGELELGTCEVSIPKSHQQGHMESPSWWHLEFSEDETRHIMLRKVEPLDAGKFYTSFRSELDAARSRDVFVFVHGYNVSFEDSARRTAQLAYDLGFPGVPVMYSWPSQAALSGYMADENNALRSQTPMRQFLSGLAAQSNGARIHLIAHSMGNRVLTEAMRNLALTDPSPLFSEVILTAPDIDAIYFKNEIAPAIQKIARRVTLYASSDDKALLASKKAHGGDPRAGESVPIVVVPGIDTVDASGIDVSLLGLGHSYFAETKLVLDDINLLLTADKPPAERSLREQLEGAGKYWKLSPAAAVTTAAVTTAAIAAQGDRAHGARFLSLHLVLLLAVLLAACGVGAWLLLRARRKAA